MNGTAYGWMLVFWCASGLLVACSDEGAATPGSDGHRAVRTAAGEASSSSQAKDYASCEALRGDAGVFLQDRHALDRPAEPEWPSNSISCAWSFSDDDRCRAIDFVPGSGTGDCISDMLYITVNRSVGALDSVEEAREHFSLATPGRIPWVSIEDLRLRRPEYANIAVFKSSDNHSVWWEFRMAVTGVGNREPQPTEVVVRHILRHPGGEQPREQLKAISRPPPSDAAVVGSYLQMLEAFEAGQGWP